MRLFKKGLLYLVTLSVIIILLGAVVEFVTGTSYVSFNIKNTYTAELKVDECGTCFLDYPIDFALELKDKDSNSSFYSFFSGDGPQIRFLFSEENPSLILIEGYGQNEGLHWIIDQKESSIRQDWVSEEIENECEVIYELY